MTITKVWAYFWTRLKACCIAGSDASLSSAARRILLNICIASRVGKCTYCGPMGILYALPSPEKNKESQTPLQYRSDGRSHHGAFAHATSQYMIFGGLFSFRPNDGHVCDAISEPTGLSRHETAFQFL